VHAASRATPTSWLSWKIIPQQDSNEGISWFFVPFLIVSATVTTSNSTKDLADHTRQTTAELQGLDINVPRAEPSEPDDLLTNGYQLTVLR
jgi:hypothetical protein